MPTHLSGAETHSSPQRLPRCGLDWVHQSVPGNTTHRLPHPSLLYNMYPRVGHVRIAHTLNFTRAPETVLLRRSSPEAQLLIIHKKGVTAIHQSNQNHFLHLHILPLQRHTVSAHVCTLPHICSSATHNSQYKHVTERHVSQSECMPHPHNRREPSSSLQPGFCIVGDSAFKWRNDAGCLYLGGRFSLTTAPCLHKDHHATSVKYKQREGGKK